MRPSLLASPLEMVQAGAVGAAVGTLDGTLVGATVGLGL